MKATNLLILCLVLLFPACTGAQYSQHAAMDTWTHQQGGCVLGVRTQRVSIIGNTLAKQAGCSALRFHVLQSKSVTAYSWPSGDVFLTAGLVDLATDDEIAASIAHELGHLLSDGHVQSAVSLRGANTPIDVEQRADFIGCQLLCATGRSPRAMMQALSKVCGASPSLDCQEEIRIRIALIDHKFPK